VTTDFIFGILTTLLVIAGAVIWTLHCRLRNALDEGKAYRLVIDMLKEAQREQ
jgi:hypothetical protein